MPGQSRAPLIVIPVLVLALAAPVSAGDRVDRPGLDPARGYDLAVEAMRRGDYSLARSYLDPVVISPRLSRKGRARAYHLRGLTFYRDGLYVSAGQDYRRALEFFPTLAEARNALAWLRLKGRGLKRDPARAVQLYRLAARQGHVESSFNLALLLMKGTGGPADPREALGWFQAAADADHAEAAALAGQILARGRSDAGIAPDHRRARVLLTRAADAGHPGAQLELGMLLEDSDAPAARDWYRAAASQGVAAAQARLGHLHDRGAPGIEVDREQALMWFREAAKQGDARAQSWLGWAYDAGVAVEADAREALRWYTRAARRDDPTAQLNLARLHLSGRGTAASTEQARYWFEQAAEQGELSALAGLAWLLATAPDPNQRDGARALELARRAVARERTPRTLEVLAAALAETGRFEEAAETQTRAIEAVNGPAAEPGEAGVEGLRGRLQAYRAGRPWRTEGRLR